MFKSQITKFCFKGKCRFFCLDLLGGNLAGVKVAFLLMNGRERSCCKMYSASHNEALFHVFVVVQYFDCQHFSLFCFPAVFGMNIFVILRYLALNSRFKCLIEKLSLFKIVYRELGYGYPYKLLAQFVFFYFRF